MSKSLAPPPSPTWRYVSSYSTLRRALKVAACLWLAWLCTTTFSRLGRHDRWRFVSYRKATTSSENPNSTFAFETYKPLPIQGFANQGKPINVTCDSLEYSGNIAVQDSVHVKDDLFQIALSLDKHPMIVYPENVRAAGAPLDEAMVGKTWRRLAGASVWLEHYGVFFVITRVIFFDDGVVSWPVISFVRVQLFDQEWNHLENHTLTWNDRTLTYPHLIDIPVDFDKGGKVYGPEDARIVLEDHVKNPEPVIVFNMISRQSEWKRAMHFYRPFSQAFNIFTIRGRERRSPEKNWAPFFLGSDDQKPSQHINFVYMFSPLQVLYCSLVTGDCDLAFDQSILGPGLLTEHDGAASALKGGSNLVRIPLDHLPAPSRRQIKAWVGLPRTHINTDCHWGAPVYRPMFFVIVYNGGQFYSAWASGAVDFAEAVLTHDARKDACQSGRVLIPNSISRWDHRAGLSRDVMTIVFSVDDATNQVARVTGLFSILRGLPVFKSSDPVDMSMTTEHYLRNVELSAVGNDVERCAIEASYKNAKAIESQFFVDHPDHEEERKRKRIEDAKKKIEESAKAKLEEETKKELEEEMKKMEEHMKKMVEDGVKKKQEANEDKVKSDAKSDAKSDEKSDEKSTEKKGTT